MFFVIVASIIGVLFYEALRIYNCFSNTKHVIPNVGFTKNVTFFIYFLVLSIFIAVSIFLSLTLVPGPPLQAFLLGFSVPSGANLAMKKQVSGEVIDDLASQSYSDPPSLYRRTEYWYQKYMV